MRKLVVFLHSSLDGFVEGPQGAMDIGWITYNHELEDFANEVLQTADTIVWGRKTYEMMYDYWPTVLSNENASEHELNHAKWIENVEKVIFSKALNSVDWHNSRLVKKNVKDEIIHMKQQEGEDIVVLGSPRFAHYLMQLDVVDEYKITVSPTLIGKGLPLFQNIHEQVDLKLIDSKTFESGALGLIYQKNKE
ncbi:dihydrofolate reductase family protein [Staphylococcus xylosus]|uniref:dihydrofolate reductase family protein n=1 Tax=Staphylococcus xylosus TaxID=1288 RepID=UPI000D1D1C6E|nr:dihydrofolate reductase family protein [Staphylococcus xylosus]MCM3518659.1 dihydrofolate reductase family protein [Staphylococcus xylosus]MCQ3817389.1 dihydrofolate reductase [Staphylococcus xylosus]MCQ3820092.1 dihydrofolate reductase [Staphylococcus xylosus]PTH98916.1 dihydrofolate reductase [Staphylococcus xylosus]UBV37582.1 dihydrofolate reductase family protein [Staphylococcus xylosus]